MMTRNEAIQLLTNGTDGIREWNRRRLVEESPDLSEVDFTRADLSGVDFSSTNLERATFVDASLASANLTSAKLTKCCLEGCCLRNAKLSGPRIEISDLVNHSLSPPNPPDSHSRELLEKLSSSDEMRALLEDGYRQLLAGQTPYKAAILTGANAIGADFSRANLKGVEAIEACFSEAVFCQANLSHTFLADAVFLRATLSGADLTRAYLVGADFHDASLENATLNDADLTESRLIGTNFKGARIAGCRIYGISVWNVDLQEANQSDLIISGKGDPTITVDNLEVGQFIYLLLNNERIRHIIDTISSKVVLILGRFTPQRKMILDAIRAELRRHDYMPVMFDFQAPESRDLTETISLLAHMARFIIADITDAVSIPQELQRIVPGLPSVPVQPLLEESSREYGMFEHFRRYPWVMPVHHYDHDKVPSESFVRDLITVIEEKASELRQRE